MFVGWIRKNSLENDLKILAQKMVIDENLVLKTIEQNQGLAFGIYEEKNLLGIITAYEFESLVYINNLYYLKDVHIDTLERLFSLLLKNLYHNSSSIIFMANKAEKNLLENLDFKLHANFTKLVYGGSSIPFNFSSATSKSISNPNYFNTIKQIDYKVFDQDRIDYISKVCEKASSLYLSTNLSYQHSYAINKTIIKLSPWIIDDELFLDAEKLLRGVLYHRGLKHIVTVVPKDAKDILQLYNSYKFEKKDDLYLIYKNKKPNINLDLIYGF